MRQGHGAECRARARHLEPPQGVPFHE